MSLLDIFSKVPDPRVDRTKHYSVAQILVISVLSYLCGHTGYRGIKRFSDNHSDLLCQHIQLDRIPSHVTIRDVLQRVDQDELIKSFHLWVGSISSFDLQGEWVSGDGKTLCSTVSNSQNSQQDFQAVVSLFAHKSGLIQGVAHYKNKSKNSGEQHGLRWLLQQIEGVGAVLTIDALHTQKKRYRP